eukprot:ANDGO_03653.mRNA.1 hypothetical protein
MSFHAISMPFQLAPSTAPVHPLTDELAELLGVSSDALVSYDDAAQISLYTAPEVPFGNELDDSLLFSSMNNGIAALNGLERSSSIGGGGGANYDNNNSNNNNTIANAFYSFAGNDSLFDHPFFRDCSSSSLANLDVSAFAAARIIENHMQSVNGGFTPLTRKDSYEAYAVAAPPDAKRAKIMEATPAAAPQSCNSAMAGNPYAIMMSSSSSTVSNSNNNKHDSSSLNSTSNSNGNGNGNGNASSMLTMSKSSGVMAGNHRELVQAPWSSHFAHLAEEIVDQIVVALRYQPCVSKAAHRKAFRIATSDKIPDFMTGWRVCAPLDRKYAAGVAIGVTTLKTQKKRLFRPGLVKSEHYLVRIRFDSAERGIRVGDMLTARVHLVFVGTGQAVEGVLVDSLKEQQVKYGQDGCIAVRLSFAQFTHDAFRVVVELHSANVVVVSPQTVIFSRRPDNFELVYSGSTKKVKTDGGHEEEESSEERDAE